MGKYRHFLLKEEYLTLLEEKSLVVDPILDEKTQCRPTHIDLRLDTRFRIYRKTLRESFNEGSKESEELFSNLIELPMHPDKGKIVLHPGQLVLGQTFEYIGLPWDIMGFLDGRSSLGRSGIIVHATASSIDPGFCGHLTFEFFNIGEMPVVLYPLQRVGRISFYRFEKPVDAYGGTFQYNFSPKIDNIYIAKDLVGFREKLKSLEQMNDKQKHPVQFPGF